MSLTIVINLGSGDLDRGFDRVTAQRWQSNNSLPEQFTGSLPPAPHLQALSLNWQAIYRALCDRLQFDARFEIDRIDIDRADEDDDEFEIEETGVTAVSEREFGEISATLQSLFNEWLKADGFRDVVEQLLKDVDRHEEVRVVLETGTDLVRRLPWHSWSLFYRLPRAEIALSRPEFIRRTTQRSQPLRQKVRILAVLGNSAGIDLEEERQFLHQLEDADTEFVVEPSRSELRSQLQDERGWDILFFAGHSQTEGETGRLYINGTDSVTLADLETELDGAISRGLRLAIFNSCDGLGLANALATLHIPLTIVMREPVPNRVAQAFFNHFLDAFALQRQPLYTAVRKARLKLTELEAEFPGASWLPVVSQNPAVEPPTWLKLGGLAPCPYRGLFAFGEDDAEFFFGREAAIASLRKQVEKQPLVAAIGPSGSGKSSLVFAGLVPELRRDRHQNWQIASMRPGSDPIASLATAIAPLISESATPKTTRLAELELEANFRRGQSLADALSPAIAPASRLLLAIDQFEELYTLCSNSDRKLFIQYLLQAIRTVPHFSAVLAVRADFFGAILSDTDLATALEGNLLPLSPMTPEQLRDAILKPAAKMQVGFEPDLCDRLIEAVRDRPGSLPLLEFALTQLWQRQTQGLLTHAAYESLGGLELALVNYAESVFAQLDEGDRLRVPDIFVQLIQPGVETEDTRRLATREEIQSDDWELVSRLAEARLLSICFDDTRHIEMVEIVHEALIRNWGRLQQWMRAVREFRFWQEQLRGALRQWVQSDRDSGTLLRGKPLTDAEFWWELYRDRLGEREQEFVRASIDARDREFRSRKRRRQGLIGGLVAGIVLLTGQNLFAAVQWRRSAINEVAALLASSEALHNDGQEIEAAIEALRAASQLERLPLQWLPGLPNSDRTSRQVRDRLLALALQNRQVHQFEASDGNSPYLVRFSPGGRYIAIAESFANTLTIWDSSGRQIASLDNHWGLDNEANLSRFPDWVTDVSFSADGEWIATVGKDRSLQLWSIDGTRHNIWWTPEEAENWFDAVAFAHNSQTLATFSKERGEIVLWTREGEAIRRWVVEGDRDITNLQFSPNGLWLAGGSDRGSVRLWQLAEDEAEVRELPDSTGETIAFSADSTEVYTSDRSGNIVAWSTAGNGNQTAIFTGEVDGWRWGRSSSASLFGTANDSGQVAIWNGDGVETIELAGERAIGLHTNAAGQRATVVDSRGTVSIWELDNPLRTAIAAVDVAPDRWSVAVTPDEELLAIASDRGTELRTLDGELIGELEGTAAIVSPAGNYWLTNAESRWIVWTRAGDRVKEFRGVRTPIFSPDERYLALEASSDSGETGTSIWDVVRNQLVSHWPELNNPRFTADGTRLFGYGERQIVPVSGDATSFPYDVINISPDRQLLLARLNHQIFQLNPDGSRGVARTGDSGLDLMNWDGRSVGEIIGERSIFHGDRRLLLTSLYHNRTSALWDFSGNLMALLQGQDGEFSSDGLSILTQREDRFSVWELDGSHRFDIEKQSLQTFYEAQIGVASDRAVFSPNSQAIAYTFVTAQEDNTTTLYSRDGALLADFDDPLGTFQFLPEGDRAILASWGDSGFELELWQVYLEIDELVEMHCDRLADFLEIEAGEGGGDRQVCS